MLRLRGVPGRGISGWTPRRPPTVNRLAAAAARPRAAAMDAAPLQLPDAYVPGLQRWVDRCNDGAAAAAAGAFVPLTCGGAAVGLVHREFAARLAAFPAAAAVGPDGVAVAPGAATPAARTAALGAALEALRADGAVPGWRGELYPVAPAFGAPPLFLVERAAAPWLGVRCYGVHVNGYVEAPGGGLELWVARRAAAKPTWPGRLDHLAAGGQPEGLSVRANVEKELAEEASVPAALAACAAPGGVVSYAALQHGGRALKRDVLFCWDLRLPPDFVPTPADGEVESFERVPLAEAARLAACTDEFKDNCNLVVADFLVRRGALGPDQPGYLALVRGLRAGECD